MGQITIYLENGLEEKMKAVAKSEHLSQSKWIADLIRNKLCDKWPSEVAELAGSWRDFPTAEEIRGSLGEDIKRVQI